MHSLVSMLHYCGTCQFQLDRPSLMTCVVTQYLYNNTSRVCIAAHPPIRHRNGPVATAQAGPTETSSPRPTLVEQDRTWDTDGPRVPQIPFQSMISKQLEPDWGWASSQPASKGLCTMWFHTGPSGSWRWQSRLVMSVMSRCGWMNGAPGWVPAFFCIWIGSYVCGGQLLGIPLRPNIIVHDDLHQLRCLTEGFDQDRRHPKATFGHQNFCDFLASAANDIRCFPVVF